MDTTDPDAGLDSSPTPKPVPHTWATSDGFVPRVFVRPALRFMHLEAAGGVVMLISAVIALVWANSPVQGG
jgi:NhaA family Na+:H+ antiporter